MRKLAITICLLFTCFFAFASTSSAVDKQQTPQKPSGITISPASAQVELPGAEAQHRLEFFITNNESKPKTINISAADFNTLGESGGLVFVGTNPTKLQRKYGLATWLTIPQTTIIVQPKQTSTITAFVLNQNDLSPGGHYGALMLSIEGSSIAAKAQNKVALQPIASSLLFVNKKGGDTHVLKLTDVYISHNPLKLPSDVTLRFKNSGNTHLIPRGVVTITSPGGKLISKGIINENSGLILPETTRRFTVPLNKISNPVRPGNYTIRVDFRFDGIDQFRSYQSKLFWIAPIPIIIATLVIAVFVATGYSLAKNKTVRKSLARIGKKLSKNFKR
jgi:hypothetical protein